MPDEEVLDQIAALPAEALDSYVELMTTLQIVPWNGSPQHPSNPDGAVRHWIFRWPSALGRSSI
jgi:hypothetical protein